MFRDEIDTAIDPMKPAGAEFFKIPVGDGEVGPLVVILVERGAALHERGTVVFRELPAMVMGHLLDAFRLDFMPDGEADTVKLLAKREDAENDGQAETDENPVGQKTEPFPFRR